MNEPFSQIVTLLRARGVDFQVEKHAPIITSEEAAAVRGRPMSDGAKCLLLRIGDDFVLVVIPGDRRLASAKLRAYLNRRQMRFATPTEVQEQMGCEIGACHPFGHLSGIRTVIDASLPAKTEIAFSAGRRDRTIIIKGADLAAGSSELVDIAD